jgi:Fe-S cluster assembly iron-binding protein IscA
VEEGFRLVMNRALLNQVGGVEVDYLSGPFRRGFNVKASSQGASCSSESCSC